MSTGDIENAARDETPACEAPRKIGLALSGGGFRASLFHLGVIRRLEERGIMKDVEVISCVSGGSIVGAYYVCQMEQRLRTCWSKYERDPDGTRLGLFKEIAADFIAAVGTNPRNRAVVFAPFYHPWLSVKALFPWYSRSDIIQAEYDRLFYHGDNLDQLPTIKHADCTQEGRLFVGPKVILNTTSLLTGKRVPFSRAGVDELRNPNENGLQLSRVVGASSCVLGVMTPVEILGDVLVDGGVSDNQGIEGLLQEECNVLLISDASGQMEAVNSVRSSAFKTLMRTTSIFQFQIRSKLIDRLSALCGEEVAEFAFVHLLLNLKDRAQQIPNITRISSEFIPALARIRTDLDQFSPIECDALMYHGYTLIEAQIERHCGRLAADYVNPAQPMKAPPLFTAAALSDPECRAAIRSELEAGQTTMLVQRIWKRYPRLVCRKSLALVAKIAGGMAFLAAIVGGAIALHGHHACAPAAVIAIVMVLATCYGSVFAGYCRLRTRLTKEAEEEYARFTKGVAPSIEWNGAPKPEQADAFPLQ